MKQHFLPQCYLREFTNSEGKLHTLDLNLFRFGRKVFDNTRYPMEVCRSKDFYTIDSNLTKDSTELMHADPYFLENKFGEYEGKYPKLIAKLKREQSYLHQEDASLLMLIVLDFKLRNPFYRDRVFEKGKQQVIEKAHDELRRKVGQLNDDFIRRVADQSRAEMMMDIDALQLKHMADKNFAERSHLASLIRRKKDEDGLYRSFCNHLLRFEWLLLRSNQSFITTDNPGFSLDKNNNVQNTNFGDDFSYFLPLTPSLCFAVSSQGVDRSFRVGAGKKQLTIVNADIEMIRVINESHGHYFTQHVFANTSELINQIADQINAKYYQVNVTNLDFRGSRMT